MKISKRQLKRIIREEYSRLKRRGLIKETFGPMAGDHAYTVAQAMVKDFVSSNTIPFIMNCDKGIELFGKFNSGDCPMDVEEDLMEALEHMEMEEGIDLKVGCQALCNVVHENY